MKSNKILFLMTGSYPPKEGIGSYVLNLAKRLTYKGYDVTILTRNREGKKQENFLDGNIKIVSIPIIKIPFFGLFHFAHKIRKLLSDKEFDIIHYNTPLLPYISTLQSKRKVVTVHSTMKESVKFLEPLNIKTLLKKIMGLYFSPLMEKSLFNNCDTIIAVSQTTKRELEDMYNINSSKIIVLPNCIDDSIFYDKNISREKQIVYIGRIDYGKGILELIEAIRNNKKLIQDSGFKFVFVGSGPLREMFLSKLRYYAIEEIVVSYAYLNQREISDLLNKSAYSIINSKYETGPRTAIESMATGTPVISTKVGLLKEIKDSNTFIEILHKSKGIEHALRKCIEIYNTEKYYVLKKEALRFSKNYICRNNKIKIEEIYMKGIYDE